MSGCVIEYVDGIMKVTHSTGVIDSFTVEDLSQVKATFEDIANQYDINVSDIETCISNCQASTLPPQ